jgi:hypothetical protein
MADQGMLARLLAGLIGPGAQQPPAPNFAPQPWTQPFTGLRNEPAPPQLPPFEQPGQMLGQFQPPIPSASRQSGYGDAPPMPPPVAQSAPPQGAAAMAGAQ